MKMLNASLSYEILMYLNSFYFGMFGSFEIATITMKGINRPEKYVGDLLKWDVSILIVFLLIETIRIYLGRKSSLSEHGWHVILSVILTIPCIYGTCYLLWIQQIIIRLEQLLCALLLVLQTSELACAIIFMFQSCRPTIYT